MPFHFSMQRTSNFFVAFSVFRALCYRFPSGARPIKISCNTIFLMIFHEMGFFPISLAAFLKKRSPTLSRPNR